MRALITNDDGIDSAGLRRLAQVAVAAGLKVTVAAPDGERSGTSAAMSGLAAGGRLLVANRALDGLQDVHTVAVQASPAMIVFVGTHGAFGPPPDIVLAGINRGPNIGRAILHSGTVGAALTAASAGLPALAVSLASDRAEHWDTATEATTRALEWFLPRAEVPVVVNVNAPDRPADQLRGLHAARLASYGVARAIIKDICRQLDQDKVVWDRQRHTAQPLLCDGDGPIPAFRDFFRQFYAEWQQDQAPAHAVRS